MAFPKLLIKLKPVEKKSRNFIAELPYIQQPFLGKRAADFKALFP